MRKMLCFGLVALVWAGVAQAGVQYEFRQMVRSDIERMQREDVTGRGLIDGSRSRIDFHSGSQYGAGTYIVTEDGGKQVLVISTEDKTYAVLDIATMASKVAGSQIRVENLKTQFDKVPGKAIIAGLPTEHYRLIATYEMVLVFGELEIRQTVHTTVEKWTTAAFGDVAEDFFATGLLKTGNAELDILIEAETRKFAGFPLRQVVTVVTSANPPAKTNLPVKPQRRQVSEMVVTAIEARDVPASQFAIPKGFVKVDRPKALEKTVAESVVLE